MARPRKTSCPDLYWLARDRIWCVNLTGKRLRLGRDKTSAEAKLRRLWGEHLLRGPDAAPVPAALSTIDDLIFAYWQFAQRRYTKNGKPNGQATRIKSALAVLRDLYGPTPIRDFGPLALATVREAMAKRWTRKLVNVSLGCLKRAWKWAAQNELIDAAHWHRLQVVEGLRHGQGREPDPVGTVDAATVTATLAHCGYVVAAMIRVQELCGMRPGEVCALTPGAIDRSGDVWVYRVPDDVNKTHHQGRPRLVPIGPQAQRVLTPFLVRAPEAHCFSPAEDVADLQARGVKCRPLRNVSAFTVRRYHRIVSNAARLAKVPHWHPNQLRHNCASRLRKLFGLEAARVVLGHSSAAVTEVYAEADTDAALDAARKAG